jgi:hypothetical protein
VLLDQQVSGAGDARSNTGMGYMITPSARIVIAAGAAQKPARRPEPLVN